MANSNIIKSEYGYLEIRPEYLREMADDFPSVFTPDAFCYVEYEKDLNTEGDWDRLMGKDFDWDLCPETVIPLTKQGWDEFQWWDKCCGMNEYQRTHSYCKTDDRSSSQLWYDFLDVSNGCIATKDVLKDPEDCEEFYEYENRLTTAEQCLAENVYDSLYYGTMTKDSLVSWAKESEIPYEKAEKIYSEVHRWMETH